MLTSPINEWTVTSYDPGYYSNIPVSKVWGWEFIHKGSIHFSSSSHHYHYRPSLVILVLVFSVLVLLFPLKFIDLLIYLYTVTDTNLILLITEVYFDM